MRFVSYFNNLPPIQGRKEFLLFFFPLKDVL